MKVFGVARVAFKSHAKITIMVDRSKRARGGSNAEGRRRGG